jgi:hypothetical protein
MLDMKKLDLGGLFDGFRLNLECLPKYDGFNGEFIVKWDNDLSEVLINGEYKKINGECLTKYEKLVHRKINDLGEITVFHKNRKGLGRMYSDADASPCCHSKFIKHTMFKHLGFVDADMVKGHPSILRFLCKLNGVPTTTFDTVVFDFDKTCEDVIKHYETLCGVILSKENIKFFFNSTIYGGGYSTWLDKLRNVKDCEKFGYELKDIPDGIPEPDIFVKFRKTCRGLSELIYVNNPEFVEKVCRGLDAEIYEKKNKVMSYYCGTIENHILYFVYETLVNIGAIKNKRCLLELDGLCIEGVEGVNYEDAIETVNRLLEDTEIRFKIKGYGDYVISEAIEECNKNRTPVVEEAEVGEAVEEAEEETEALASIATILEELELKKYKTVVSKKAKKLSDKNVDLCEENNELMELDLKIIQTRKKLKDRKVAEATAVAREKRLVAKEKAEEVARVKRLKNAVKAKKEADKEEKSRKEKQRAEMNLEMYTFVDDDETASLIIFEKVKDILIPRKDGRLFLKMDNIWVCDAELINNELLNIITLSDIAKDNEKKHYIPYAKNVKCAKNIRELVIVKIKAQKNVPDIYDKFHSTTKNRLCFKDGVLDMLKKKFYKWSEIKFEYYTTQMIRYEYGAYYNDPDRDMVIEIKNKIFRNLFGGDTDKFLHFIARAFGGRCDDKNWATLLANRDSGKGVLFDLLEAGFDGYVKPFELGNILVLKPNETEEMSRKMYWLLDYEFVRLAISQETPKTEDNANKRSLKINGSMQKKLSGGNDTQKARRNYDTHDTEFKIDTTFFYVGNDELQTNLKDADDHRIRFNSVLQYKTKSEIDKMRADGEPELLLSSYLVKDPSVSEMCKKNDYWRKAVVYLICESFIDEAVVVERDEEDDGDISLRKELIQNFNITTDKEDVMTCSEVYTKMSIYGEKKINVEFKSMGVLKNKNRSRGLMRNVMCFYGVKRLEDEIDENAPVNGVEHENMLIHEF